MHYKLRFLFLSLISSTSFSAAESILAPEEHNQDVPYGRASAHTIHHVLKKAKIVPFVIDDFNPLCSLDLTYSSHISVLLGNKLLPQDTQNAPLVEVSCPSGFGFRPTHSVSGAELMIEDDFLVSSPTNKAGPDKKKAGPFTVILTDPDAPSRKHPKWSEMCHWIVTLSTSISPSTVSSSSVSFELPPFMENEHPVDIIPYKAPGPPPKTGYHRYVFLLFSGNNSNLTAPEDRQHWGMGKKGKGVKEWAKTNNLQVVGANFFYARNKRQ